MTNHLTTLDWIISGLPAAVVVIGLVIGAIAELLTDGVNS